MSAVPISYARLGGGEPPFVLVHGFGGSRQDWEQQTTFLARHHLTIAVDLGGHGASAPVSEHGLIDQHGEDLAALLQSFDLPPAVLVGHSMGCRVALQAAVTAPARVAGLVLVDGSSLGDTGAGPGEEAVTEASYDKVLGRVFAAMFPAGDAQGLVPRLVAQARSLPREIGVSLFADLRRWDASNLAPTLARLSRPLLLIQSTVHGDDNSRRSLAAGETSAYLELVRRAVPHARVEIVPGVGHYPQLERPATVNALLEAFAGDLADLADSANLAT